MIFNVLRIGDNNPIRKKWFWQFLFEPETRFWTHTFSGNFLSFSMNTLFYGLLQNSIKVFLSRDHKKLLTFCVQNALLLALIYHLYFEWIGFLCANAFGYSFLVDLNKELSVSPYWLPLFVLFVWFHVWILVVIVI